MRRFVSFGPAFVTLLTAGVVVLAVPAAVRRIETEQAIAQVRLARQRLDSDDILERLNQAVRDVASAVKPSVVHLDVADTSSRSFRGSTGAGWVYDDLGHVVTNAHVVSGSDLIRVQFHDGRVASAEIVGLDPLTDIAVVRVDTGDHLMPIRRATDQRVQIGERVFAFGSPFGFKFSMSEGIVSGVGRTARTPLGAAGLSNFIQTDAAVNPGNSGGPLVDVRGRLVGMNVAIATAQEARGGAEGQSAGISFAIPLKTIESRVEQIIAGGPVVSGYLGVRFDARESFFDGGGHEGQGVVINEVVPDGPAGTAGLKAGDVVVAIDGDPVASGESLRSLISTSRPGQVVRLKVRRGEESLELSVTLGEMPQTAQADAYLRLFAEQAGALIIDDDGGALVRRVMTDGPADKAGLAHGQYVIGVNDKDVHDVAEFVAALRDTGAFNGKPVTLKVLERNEAGEDQVKTLSIRLQD